jgi:hypothetical protein
MKDRFRDIVICPFCGVPTKVIWVHGHGQCAVCKNVIEVCCSGEMQQPDVNNSDQKSNQICETNDDSENEKKK